MPALVGPGHELRWLSLVVLAAVAVAPLVRDRSLPRPGRPFARVVALAGWLVALSVVSAAWSVDPRLTIGRAGSFTLLLVTASALGIAARTRPRLPRALLLGILAGAVAAALAGVLLLAFSYWDAIQPRAGGGPSRYRGLGESPDTVAMLSGLAAPIGLWLLVQARSRKGLLYGLAAVMLLVGSISASGSRGGLLAACVGSLVMAALLPFSLRRRTSLALAICLAAASASVMADYIKPNYPVPAAVPGQTEEPSGQRTSGGGLAVGASVDTTPEYGYRGLLADELFRTYAGNRPFLSSSGRLENWYEAAKQADARPALGYGFGTEERVFIDRVYNFNGGHVESSIIGIYLQLGSVGLASLLALLAAIALAAVAALRRVDSLEAPALPAAGVLSGGLVLALVQSYLYSVGNVATISFWVAAFVVAATASIARDRLTRPARPSPERKAIVAA